MPVPGGGHQRATDLLVAMSGSRARRALSAERWSTDASRAVRAGAQLRWAGDESNRRFASALITSISATPLAHCLMMNYARRPLA